MTNTKAPMADGQVISYLAGRVLIRLQCVRSGQAYRAAACYGSTGAEVPELSRSFPTEAQGRAFARTLAEVFRAGRTIQSVIGE